MSTYSYEKQETNDWLINVIAGRRIRCQHHIMCKEASLMMQL